MFSKAYRASPLYPIKFPTFFPLIETYKHFSFISTFVSASIFAFSKNSFKNSSTSVLATCNSSSVVSISICSGFFASISLISTLTNLGAKISKKTFFIIFYNFYFA